MINFILSTILATVIVGCIILGVYLAATFALMLPYAGQAILVAILVYIMVAVVYYEVRIR